VPEQPTHSDIFQQIGALSGKVDALLLLMEERGKTGDRRIEALETELRNIRDKQQEHGNRIAQGVMLSVLFSLFITTAATLWAAKIAVQVPQQTNYIR